MALRPDLTASLRFRGAEKEWNPDENQTQRKHSSKISLTTLKSQDEEISSKSQGNKHGLSFSGGNLTFTKRSSCSLFACERKAAARAAKAWTPALVYSL